MDSLRYAPTAGSHTIARRTMDLIMRSIPTPFTTLMIDTPVTHEDVRMEETLIVDLF